MNILSWNIQATQNCLGEFDHRQTVEDIYTHLDGQLPDVICLQEVARNMADYGSNDQKAILESAFPDHDAVWGPAFSWPGVSHCQEFGNLTLVAKGRLLDSRIHSLPLAVSGEHLQMPRIAVEVVAGCRPENAIRILNTHLAFHSDAERRQQLTYLSDLKEQYQALSVRNPPVGSRGSYQQIPAPDKILLCGDLNLTPESDDYQYLLYQAQWLDCWAEVNPEIQHSPTCGCFDKAQWPEGPHCRDYGMINAPLANHLKDVKVNLTTSASDHQPISFNFDLSS